MSMLLDEFAAFEQRQPDDLIGDPVWKLPAYRIGLFLSQVVQKDCVSLRRFPGTEDCARQLQRAVDGIPANITDGYGRLSGKDRARYYEIALSSAREAREWYRRAAQVLDRALMNERALLLTRVIKILTKAIPEERAGASELRIRRAMTRRREDQQGKESPPGTDLDPSKPS
jgi:four helix bundle protein